MGVFKKLKDVLFDIEDEEIPVISKPGEKNVKAKEEVKPKPRSEYTEENTIKEIKIPQEEVPERELIKAESTFNFPLEVEERQMPKLSRSYDYDETPKKKNDGFDYARVMREEPKSTANKNFKPTPIISPVYGILDQNYSKDDIIVKTDIGVKGPDLDEVRKKAYGLENKKEAKKKEEADIFEDPLKTLDEILMEEEKAKQKEEMTPSAVPPAITEEPVVEAITSAEDTVETDLFNLIDSMYEEKEESEE